MAGPAARVQVRGARELRNAMKAADGDLRDLTRLHKGIGDLVQQAARQRVPIRSGELAGSIKSKGTRTRASVSAGSAGVPYAGPIHFGWPRRNIESQPFLYDALDDRHDAVIERYETEIENIVRKIDRMTPG